MVLDPTFKLSFWKKNTTFINKHYSISDEQVLQIFSDTATKFETDYKNKTGQPVLELSQPKKKTPAKSQPLDIFSSEFYEATTPTDTIEGEIKKYLNEDPEPHNTQILTYWRNRQDSFPVLARMARCYLAIPATSASSERVFSKG
jgi:hypothetical protein